MPGRDRLSRIFAALSHQHRRVVLYYLREHDGAALSTLADCVTGWGQAGPGPESGAEYDTVRIGLHHEHLPLLADAGLVTYDADSGSVALADLPAVADELLSTTFATDASTREADDLLRAPTGDPDE